MKVVVNIRLQRSKIVVKIAYKWLKTRHDAEMYKPRKCSTGAGLSGISSA